MIVYVYIKERVSWWFHTQKHLPLNPRTWVQDQKTHWNKRTDSYRVSSDFHTRYMWVAVHMHVQVHHACMLTQAHTWEKETVNKCKLFFKRKSREQENEQYICLWKFAFSIFKLSVCWYFPEGCTKRNNQEWQPCMESRRYGTAGRERVTFHFICFIPFKLFTPFLH